MNEAEQVPDGIDTGEAAAVLRGIRDLLTSIDSKLDQVLAAQRPDEVRGD